MAIHSQLFHGGLIEVFWTKNQLQGFDWDDPLSGSIWIFCPN